MTRGLCVIACAASLVYACTTDADNDRPAVAGDCIALATGICKPALEQGGSTQGPPSGNGNAGASAEVDGGALPNPPTGAGQNGGISGGNPPGGVTGVGGINGAAGSNGTGGLVDFDSSIGLGPGIPQ